MKAYSLWEASFSNFGQTACLSLFKISRPFSLNALILSNNCVSDSYFYLASGLVRLESSEFISYLRIPMYRLTSIPMIGAKNYSKVAECRYTLSEKKIMCLLTSPTNTEFRTNIMKFISLLECTCSTSRNNSGHQVANSSHILNRSTDVWK